MTIEQHKTAASIRCHRRRYGRLTAVLAVALFIVMPAGFGAVPAGFVDEPVATGFQAPTGITFAPDGRIFVAEKRGMVWVIDNGTVFATPFIDLVDEIGNAGDRGLMSVALHPDFDQNGYVYLAYVVDQVFGQPDEDANSVTHGRVTRYTANGNVADLNSRFVILGNSAADGPPNCSSTHAVGTLAFASDGSLLVSAGEGAHPEYADVGNEADCAQLFPAQDVGALRAQSDQSLGGKILRIDPDTGEGLPDNPLFDGNPNSFQSRILHKGLRNPFRFTIRPNSGSVGTLYISDVGWSIWEELNVAKAPVENFGWPCYEGVLPQVNYQSDPVSAQVCQALPANAVTEPLITWHHSNLGTLGFTGSAASGVAFYTGNSFPPQYWGHVFFSDFTGDWIKLALVDSSDQLLGIQDFGANLGAPVDLKIDPASGDLLYVAIALGEVRRIRYDTSNLPPLAAASANPTGGQAPLTVQFSSNGTFDPNNDPITLEWDFGDGTPVSVEANPSHEFTDPGIYTVTLTAADDQGNSSQVSVTINAINDLPQVAITSPANQYTFIDDEIVQLEAQASDTEDGSNLIYAWEVQLIHNNHIHPELLVSALAIPPPIQLAGHGAAGDRFSYRAILTVTDSVGQTATDSILMVPENPGVNNPPVAAANIQPSEGSPPLLVNFDASPSSDPEGDLLFYDWNFGDGTATDVSITTHIYQSEGIYPTVLTVTDVLGETDSLSTTIEAQTSPPVVLYTFTEGVGDTILDLSSIGAPLNLSIQNTGAVNWLTGGGLSLDAPVTIVSSGPAAKLKNTIQASGEFTVEAWVKPANTTQTGPARIVAMSQNPTPDGANLVLGQAGDAYDMRVRTDKVGQSDSNGLPSLKAPDGSVSTSLTHVVYTRDFTWNGYFYVDGTLVASGTKAGDFFNWGDYVLSLGNEPTGDRPWLGEFHRLAIYDRVLQPTEISQRFSLGPILAASPPSFLSQPENQITVVGQIATFSVATGGTTPITHQWENWNGVQWVIILGATQPAYTTPLTSLADDGKTFRVVASNSAGTVTSNVVTLNVVDVGIPGVDVAITPPTQSVNISESAVFSLAIMNIGEITLTNVAISDLLCDSLTFDGGDNNSDNLLQVSETWLYTCTVTNVFADFTNTATVQGIDPATGAPVQASDAATVSVLNSGTRVTTGLVALYGFAEGTGDTVADVSGVGTPLDLTVSNLSAVSWLPGGGLSIDAATALKSAGAASKLITAFQASQALSVEAWVVPGNTTQVGPARIVALSLNGYPGGGNLVMGQSTNLFETRLRTGLTNQYGTPSLATPGGSASAQLTHVMYTREASGTSRFYVNGVEVATGSQAGNFSNWGNYQLALANEPAEDRAWLGELHLVSFYARALTAAEVDLNFTAGPALGPPDTIPPVVTAPADQTVAAVDGSGTPAAAAAITAWLASAWAQDNIDGSVAVSHDAPGVFPLGATLVTFTASDALGNSAAATATLTVADQTAPVVTAPAAITVGTTGVSVPASDPAIAAFLSAATVTDNVDSGLATTTDAPADFPIGITLVTFTASDTANNPGSASASVTVQDEGLPVISVPADTTVAALDASGTPVGDATITAWLASATATDIPDGALLPGNDAPATFPLGGTLVTFTVTDSNSNTVSATATLTVADQTAPVLLNLPGDLTVPAVDGNGTPASDAALVTFLTAATAVDNVNGAVAVLNNAPPVFPVGATLVTFTATDSTGNSASGSATVTVTSSRVINGLVALYAFDEGSGAAVSDSSGIGAPLDLTIANGNAVTWLTGGGLSIDTATTIASAGPATKLISAWQTSAALTVEAWLVPGNITQFGPARIVALSQNGFPDGGNLAFGQSGDKYETRLRTSTTNQYGTPSLATANGQASAGVLTHVVYTRNAAGTRRIYVDGSEVANGTIAGDFSSWGNYALALANTPAGDRAWLGELHLVALYDRALDAAEVGFNFSAGPMSLGATDITADFSQLNWGHVEVGTSGGIQPIQVVNNGADDALISSIDFDLVSGVGHDFHVNLSGVLYTGGHDSVNIPTNTIIPAGQSLTVPVEFLPTEEQDNSVDLIFNGNFPSVGTTLNGTGDNQASDPFLHVVINAPALVIDYDADGSETVFLEGSFSHTHEPGRNLAAYDWFLDSVLFASTADATVSLPLGSHDISLTIEDDNQPPRTLTGMTTIVTTSVSQVPGVLAYSYDADGMDPAGLLNAVPATADYAERLPGLLLTAPSIGSPLMVRFVTRIQITSNDNYLFAGTGGSSNLLLVDGIPVAGTIALAPGTYDLEARFAVNSPVEFPLEVTLAQGGGSAQSIAESLLSYDLSVSAPVINGVNATQGAETGGNNVVIDGLGFFPDNEVVLHWGSTDLTDADLVITPTSISLSSPPGAGQITVSVQTSRGISNSFDFTYSPDGPLPVNFTLRNLATGIPSPTTLAMGPDERLYVGTQGGDIYALTLDDNLQVTNTQVISTISALSNPHVLGIAFNPFESGNPVRLYVSHGQLFANGGACFSGFSPYSGQISVLEGSNFDSLQALVTKLAVSNHDHSVNGMIFDNNGDLYVAAGGNTNAGVPDCALGDLPGSPLSGAIIKVETSKPAFNGQITYLETATLTENNDQVSGDLVDVAPGIDVSVYTPGLRNPYDLVYTTQDRIYATDNGPDSGFGAASTGPASEGLDPSENDELNLVEFHRYYGHPNRNRGRSDFRQNIYQKPTASSVPGDFTQPISQFPNSTNGLMEYRANTFNGAMRGELIAQEWNGTTYRVALSPDGRTVTQQQNLPVTLSSLDVFMGPGGVIFGADHGNDKVVVAEPVDNQVATRLYDIFPWRSPATGGEPFIISGVNFGSLADTMVLVDGIPATVTQVTTSRIRGNLPTELSPTRELVDIEVTTAGQTHILSQAFRYLLPAGNDPYGWRVGPSLTHAIEEVAAGVIGDVLYVVGGGHPSTQFYDIVAGTWGDSATLSPRPLTGDHHASAVLGGKLYLLGGLESGSEGAVQIYDPTSDSWSLGPTMPWSPGSASAAVINGKIYVCGGIAGNGTVTTCGVYDPATDAWNSLADMPVGRNHAAAATDGSKFYIFGGRGPGSGDTNMTTNGFADLQIYDPLTDSWQWSGAPGSTLEPLPQARGGMGSAVFFKGEFYVMGGETLTGAGATSKGVYDRVDIYDPATNSWRLGPPMVTARHGIFPALHGNQIYLPGGGTNASTSSSAVLEIYAP